MKKKDLTEKEKQKNQIVGMLLESNELKTTKDISNVLDDMYGALVQKLLDAEMDEFLGYNKGSHIDKSTENRRNGNTTKKKKVKTDKGVIEIAPPRDRDGNFEPQIIQKRQRVLEGFDDIAISMYARGLTLEDIQEMIQKVYRITLSKETISNLTSAVSEEVERWQKRRLEKCYPFVYVDCLYCPVKKDLISEKTAVYVMIGVNVKGVKDVLGIWIDQTESAHFWKGIFEDIKARGTEDIFFVSMDRTSWSSRCNRRSISENCNSTLHCTYCTKHI